MSDRRIRQVLPSGLLFALLAGCASTPTATPTPEPAGAVVSPAAAGKADLPLQSAVDAFLAGLSRRCGQAYAGVVEIDVPETADSPFAGKPLVMHVRECGRDAVRVPFHVGEDRSRTWVFTRTPSGLRFKHDHRHADGTPDALTMYGGDAALARAPAPSSLRIAFPVDAESIAMFQAGGRAVVDDQYLGGRALRQPLRLRVVAAGRAPVPGRLRPGSSGARTATALGRERRRALTVRINDEPRRSGARAFAAIDSCDRCDQRAPKRARQPRLTHRPLRQS